MGNRMYWLAGVALLAAQPALSQQQANPQITAYQGGVDAGEEADTSRIRITAMDMAVRLAGPTAQVTLEMELATDNRQDDEARLSLLLPEGAVVTGYALSVDGRMIPGSLLEQTRAREVYEDEVRGRIDPGLAEVTGNRFDTRIYPLTKGKPRRIRLSFVTALDPDRGLHLPLLATQDVGLATVRIEAAGYAQPPEARFDGDSLRFERQGDGYTARIERQGFRLDEGFYIAAGRHAGAVLAVHETGEAFLALTLDDLPEGRAIQPEGRLRIYWDRSLSRRDDLLEQEIAMIEALVERTRPSAIDIVSFASDEPVVNSLTDTRALRGVLEAQTYRGATSLAGLTDLELEQASQCLLFTDGEATVDFATAFTPDCPTALVSSSRSADSARLDALAAASGGEVVRLTAENADQLAARLSQGMASVTALRDDEGEEVSFRQLAASAGELALVAPAGASAFWDVTYRSGDGASATRRIGRPRGDAIASDGPGALWA
ncbi:hypothetical protein K3148_06825 [Qipengyuania aurantiaca]|uniref:VIT domain-containing protein n=1 Tax=Qipengyuania aurantiaca TaxID=2867233 RepID=A0ABX8ZU20_9SPHN|nr:VIT domain-containing protein [Qipengyuania aurantiaca]QZD91087.1 hypothetical protein K3148_06825 [Qipengyuania aurantiaca]